MPEKEIEIAVIYRLLVPDNNNSSLAVSDIYGLSKLALDVSGNPIKLSCKSIDLLSVKANPLPAEERKS